MVENERATGYASSRRSAPNRMPRHASKRTLRRGLLVAISGLDGSGKSTQSKALVATLEQHGVPAIRVWTSLPNSPALGVIAAPVRRPGAKRLVRSLRKRYGLVARAWTVVVAVANAEWHVRAIERHRFRGRTVVCDRYVLDSIVNLRYLYGVDRRFRLSGFLLRSLSPRASREFFLDVSPEVSTTRNDEYSLAQATIRAKLYRSAATHGRVTTLDGERPPDALAEEIARDVLSLLGR